MATCPLCTARAAKRYCPATRTSICSVCCGTKREVEIDCPSDCVFLKSGRSYEAEKRTFSPESVSSITRFDEAFFYQYGSVILSIYKEVVEERASQPAMRDLDVLEVYKALGTTMKTLSSGLFYESLPQGGPHQTVLFRLLRDFMDTQMNPQTPEHRALRFPEAADIIEFLAASAAINTGNRPKSRKYLDWLTEMTVENAPKEKNRIILP